MHDGLVDAGRVGAAHGAQEPLPGGAVGAAGVGAGLAREHGVPRHVTAAGQTAVVVEVLEAQGLALCDVQDRGRGDGVGLQPVGLGAQLEPERVRPGAQRPDVVLVEESGDRLPEVVPDLAGGGGLEGEDLVAVVEDHGGQQRQQGTAGVLAERVGQPRRPLESVGLQLDGVLEERTAGDLQQAADRRRKEVGLPEVGHRAGACRAEVVDDVGGRIGVRARLRCLSGAAHPVGDQDPGAVVGRGPADRAVGDGGGEVADRFLVEAGLLAGGVRGVHPRCLHQEQPLPGDAGSRLVDGLGDRAGVGRTRGQRDDPVGEFLYGGLAVGGDAGHRRGPRGADGEIDGETAPGRLAQRCLDTGDPGGAAPAVALGVQHRRVGDAVVDGGYLGAAEARVGDLVDLPSDLVGADQAVGPPPAELGPHRAARLGETRRAPSDRGGRGTPGPRPGERTRRGRRSCGGEQRTARNARPVNCGEVVHGSCHSRRAARRDPLRGLPVESF